MAVNFKLKANADIVSKNISKYKTKLEQAIQKGLLQAGFQLVTVMRELTQKGLDVYRNPFAPYSEQYLKQLNREGKPTTVDLFYTGRMMGSLTPDYRSVKPTGKNKVTVSFANAEMRKRALFNQVLNQPTRKFFGFDKRTESIIGKSFNDFLNKELRVL
jgi:hypothetical protein